MMHRSVSLVTALVWLVSLLLTNDCHRLFAQNVPKSEIRNVTKAEAAATDPREKIRETYQKDYAKATSPSEQDSLARKLIAVANRTTKEASKRNALLDEALELGIMAGSPKIAMAVADNKHPLGSELIFLEKQHALQRLIAGELSDTARDILNSYLYYLINETIDAEQYKTARELVELYIKLTDKYPMELSVERDARATAFSRQIDELVTLYEEYVAAAAVLKTQPNDPAANRTAGLYLCFARRDFSSGKDHLLKARDELSKVLEQEQAGATDAAALISLGDAWMDITAKVPRAYRPDVLGRAGTLYAVAKRKGSTEQQEYIAKQQQAIIDGSREILIRTVPPDETGAPLVNRPVKGMKTELAFVSSSPSPSDLPKRPPAVTPQPEPKSVTGTSQPVRPTKPMPEKSRSTATTTGASTGTTAGATTGTSSGTKGEMPDRRSQFTVVAALFGSGTNTTDLTQRVQQASKRGLLVIFVESILSQDRRIGELILVVENGSKRENLKFSHRQLVFLDARENPKIESRGFKILEAYYGTGIWSEKTMVDATELLERRLEGNRTDFTVRELVSSIPDPAFGHSKVLIVRYALNGRIQKPVMFEEHETVKLGR